MKHNTYIIPEKTGSEYYNLGNLMSFDDKIQNRDNSKLGDVLGKVDVQARMIRLETYILSIPQYKHLKNQRPVIELLVKGYHVTDISNKLNLKIPYVFKCIENFRLYAKKYLKNLHEI